MERVVYETARRIADLKVGQSISTNGRTVHQSDINLFCGITGDMNPLHLSQTDAELSPLHAIVAPATMVQAMAIGLFAQTRWLTTLLVAFVGVSEWRVENPVYPGDTIGTKVTLVGTRQTSDGRSYILEVLFEVFAHRTSGNGETKETPRVMHFTTRFLAREHELQTQP